MAKTNKYRDDINKELTKDEIRNITFRLPDKLIEQFKKECENNGLKMNSVIKEMIKKYLK